MVNESPVFDEVRGDGLVIGQDPPANTPNAAAVTLQVASAGRFVLGIGRGDSALAHLGRAPAPVETFERYLAVLRAYLRGDQIVFDDLGFHESVAPPLDTLGLADAPTASVPSS